MSVSVVKDPLITHTTMMDYYCKQANKHVLCVGVSEKKGATVLLQLLWSPYPPRGPVRR